MKRNLFLLFLLFFAYLGAFGAEIAPYLPAQQALATKTNAPITVQFPHENMKIPAGATHIFVFGHLFLDNPTRLDINGQEVPLDKNGSFIAYVPIQTGKFELLFTAKNAQKTVQAVRHIKVLGTDIVTYSQKAEFDDKNLFPQQEVEALPGEELHLVARGTPHARVWASLKGLKNGKHIDLQEDSTRPGTYRASFTVDERQKGKTVKVTYAMENGPDKTKAKQTAPAKITIRPAEELITYARITQDGVKLRQLPTAQGNLYPYYHAYGIVRVSGQQNGQLRILLSGQEYAWLEKTKLEPISQPPQTPNRITQLTTESTDAYTRLSVKGTRPVPIQLQEFKDRLELTLYYVDEMEKNFSIDNTSPVLDNIVWSRPQKDTLSLILYFKKGVLPWGHAYGFDEDGFFVTLRHKPLFTPTAQKPLNGVRILLDAGHNPKRKPPYDGAVGATGYLEYEGTLALAQDLQKALEQQGATVLLTRRGKNKLTLQERYEYALANDAHLFISLHYNALPETANPLASPRGFAIYYMHPHSFDLAASVHKAYQKGVPLADNGLIANTILFIPRISEMPSILVENAYLMFGDQEEMARTPNGRAVFVNALQNGIVNFIQNR